MSSRRCSRPDQLAVVRAERRLDRVVVVAGDAVDQRVGAASALG